MIKMDGKNGSDWIEKCEAKTGERRKIKLPRNGFVHLARTTGYQPSRKPEICLTHMTYPIDCWFFSCVDSRQIQE